MKIGIGSDHGGFELKEFLKNEFKEKGIEFEDYGTFSNDSVDYPDFGKVVGQAVVKGQVDKGIVICGSGIGISIAANKVKGVRCALCGDTLSARLSREHNDANVLAMGGRLVGTTLASEIVKVFLQTDFEGGRHKGRIQKIDEI